MSAKNGCSVWHVIQSGYKNLLTSCYQDDKCGGKKTFKLKQLLFLVLFFFKKNLEQKWLWQTQTEAQVCAKVVCRRGHLIFQIDLH